MGDSLAEANEQFHVADTISTVSSAIVHYRITHYSTLDQTSILALRHIEDTLDSLVSEIHAKGISLLGDTVSALRPQVINTCDQASKFLQDIAEAKAAIKVAASVIDLARSIVALDPQGIASDISDLTAAIEQNKNTNA